MKTIITTIDRIEGETAILKKDNTEIKYPVIYLPENAREGDIIHLTVQADKNFTQQQKQNAKEILNEILKK